MSARRVKRPECRSERLPSRATRSWKKNPDEMTFPRARIELIRPTLDPGGIRTTTRPLPWPWKGWNRDTTNQATNASSTISNPATKRRARRVRRERPPMVVDELLPAGGPSGPAPGCSHSSVACSGACSKASGACAGISTSPPGVRRRRARFSPARERSSSVRWNRSGLKSEGCGSKARAQPNHPGRPRAPSRFRRASFPAGVRPRGSPRRSWGRRPGGRSAPCAGRSPS